MSIGGIIENDKDQLIGAKVKEVNSLQKNSHFRALISWQFLGLCNEVYVSRRANKVFVGLNLRDRLASNAVNE